MFLHDFFDTKKSAVKEGETTLTKTGRVHRSTDAYGGTPREPDSLGNKLDKAGTNSIERALDIKWDRKKEWQGGVEVDTSEGMAGELIGGTIGGVAGTLGGAAVGGPVGALVGGAAGGTAGQMAGRELTKEEGRERIYSNGDRVKLNSTYADYRNPNEIFTVSQCDQERKRCWIGDKSGSGWYATFDQLIPARSRAKEDDTKLNKNIDNGHLRMLVHRAMKARQAGKPLTSIMRSDEIKTLLMAKGTGQLKNLFAEDSWHGEGEAWHGGGDDPKDAWHGQEGVTEEQLDEFLPALAAGAGALARGAAMAGGAALKGAQAIAPGLVKGAQAAGNAVVKGVQAVTPGVVKTGQSIGKVSGQVEKGLIKGFEVLDALVPGGIFDENGNIKSPQILSKFLTPQQIQQVQQQPAQQQSPSQQVAQNQQQVAAEGKHKLSKQVKIVKGPDTGKTGWIREIKHGAYKGALKAYYIDLDDGGQANNLPATALRLVKEQGVAEASNRMQKYGQLIIKRARQAKREAEAAEKAKRDAEQEKAEKEKKEGVAEDRVDSPVSSAITRRILNQRHDLLKFGPQAVMDAVDQVAEWVGEVEEIGSSDVSVWVAQVARYLQTQDGQGVAEGFPHDVDHMPGKTIKHQDTNCTTCHGRKSMYKLGNKLSADNKQGAEKVKCPTCKGTGDKPGVTEAEGPGRVDPILYKALARMTKGGYDDAKIALAIEFGLLDMKHNYAIADNYIPKLVDLYNQKQGVAEGWKDKVAGAALVGSIALGAAGANARVMPGDDPNINRLTGKPIATLQATDNAPATAEAPKGYNKEYLQKAADPNRFGRYMISVEKAQELLKNMQEGVAEGKSDYKIKSIGTDSKGDYYISPSTGKKVYKKAKVGDHENPKTGEHKGISEGANYWTKLQDTRNKKINSLVDELEKSIK